MVCRPRATNEEAVEKASCIRMRPRRAALPHDTRQGASSAAAIGAGPEDVARQLRAVHLEAQGPLHRELLRVPGWQEGSGARSERADRDRVREAALLRGLPGA